MYVPIKIYPNRWSLRGCIVRAAFCLCLAVAGFQFIDEKNLKLAVYCLSMAGFAVSMINAVAVMARQPMVKVLEDRFSVYTPFGYAMIRFGEVLAFRRSRMPFRSVLRIEINGSARPKFPSAFCRLLFAVVSLRFTNTVSIPGYLLGADPESVMQMLEKRRVSAVRLDAIGDYDPMALTTMG
ncbi:hypothetical protein DND132_0024 [Pseudodesulfovibrio mercurii]|uniref:Uncharacterized protein n=1 Tax=Pseudodesulfovibrio mercurii TaxID=641491 RepID=F0JCR4_9BACT|nr:hypothetical protein [Pseudodesulfovibrio mercurii]EGB13242.1 hypothetical protein DND132_0024 [Pseudodesulfovibrio mercurii]